jgi:hypothetical protein
MPGEPERMRRRERNPEDAYPAMLTQGISSTHISCHPERSVTSSIVLGAHTFSAVIPSEPERMRRKERNPEDAYPAMLTQGIFSTHISCHPERVWLDWIYRLLWIFIPCHLERSRSACDDVVERSRGCQLWKCQIREFLRAKSERMRTTESKDLCIFAGCQKHRNHDTHVTGPDSTQADTAPKHFRAK